VGVLVEFAEQKFLVGDHLCHAPYQDALFDHMLSETCEDSQQLDRETIVVGQGHGLWDVEAWAPEEKTVLSWAGKPQ